MQREGCVVLEPLSWEFLDVSLLVAKVYTGKELNRTRKDGQGCSVWSHRSTLRAGGTSRLQGMLAGTAAPGLPARLTATPPAVTAIRRPPGATAGPDGDGPDQ